MIDQSTATAPVGQAPAVRSDPSADPLEWLSIQLFGMGLAQLGIALGQITQQDRQEWLDQCRQEWLDQRQVWRLSAQGLVSRPDGRLSVAGVGDDE
jgi:hypothetical protein